MNTAVIPSQAAGPVPPHSLSIVVPMYNEVDNVEPFVTAVHEALDSYPFP